jgi:hypothetical protein
LRIEFDRTYEKYKPYEFKRNYGLGWTVQYVPHDLGTAKARYEPCLPDRKATKRLIDSWGMQLFNVKTKGFVAIDICRQEHRPKKNWDIDSEEDEHEDSD